MLWSQPAIRHSINVCAFAASEPHCKCAAPCPEYKCSRADAHSGHFFAARDLSTNHNAGAGSRADAHSGHFFAARDLSTNHNAGAGFPANGQHANYVIPGSGTSTYAER